MSKIHPIFSEKHVLFSLKFRAKVIEDNKNSGKTGKLKYKTALNSVQDVLGRPVISNCDYYTRNISSFLGYHLQPFTQKVKSYIKDNNHFLSKLKSFGKLAQGAILCTIDVVGLYPNITYSEGLTSFQRFLELRDKKQISSDTHIELAEILLKTTF